MPPSAATQQVQNGDHWQVADWQGWGTGAAPAGLGGAAAARPADARLARRAGVAAGAAVHRVVVEVRLAAVADLPVAVAVAGEAGEDRALAAGAGGLGPEDRAGVAAGAAVAD